MPASGCGPASRARRPPAERRHLCVRAPIRAGERLVELCGEQSQQVLDDGPGGPCFTQRVCRRQLLVLVGQAQPVLVCGLGSRSHRRFREIQLQLVDGGRPEAEELPGTMPLLPIILLAAALPTERWRARARPGVTGPPDAVCAACAVPVRAAVGRPGPGGVGGLFDVPCSSRTHRGPGGSPCGPRGSVPWPRGTAGHPARQRTEAFRQRKVPRRLGQRVGVRHSVVW